MYPTNKIKFFENITGYDIKSSFLGHGSQGVVFKKEKYVAKLTTCNQEAKIARWVQTQQLEWKDLPKIYNVIIHTHGVREIIREPLEDINDPEFKIFIQNFKKLICFPASNPMIQQALQTMDWLLQKGATLKDLSVENFGLREGSQVVIRDLGMIKIRDSILNSGIRPLIY